MKLTAFSELKSELPESKKLQDLVEAAEALYGGLWTAAQSQQLLEELRAELRAYEEVRVLREIHGSEYDGGAFERYREKASLVLRRFYALLLKASEQRPEAFSPSFCHEVRTELRRRDQLPFALVEMEREKRRLWRTAFRKPCLNVRGVKLSLREAASQIQRSHKDSGRAPYEALKQYFEVEKENLSSHYAALAEVRRSLAQRLTCSSYERYVTLLPGVWSLDLDERLAFHEAYLRYFGPLLQGLIGQRNRRLGWDKLEPWRLFQFSGQEDPLLNVKGEQILGTFVRQIQKLTGDERSMMTQLIEAGYCDYHNSFSFQHDHPLFLPQSQTLYLSLAQAGRKSDVLSWYRELAFAVAELAYHDQSLSLCPRRAPTFLRYLSTYALTFGQRQELKAFYGDSSDLVFDLYLSRLLLSWSFYLARDAFDLALYTQDGLEVEDYPELARHIQARYLPFLMDVDESWIQEGWTWLLCGLDPEDSFCGLERLLAAIMVLAEKPFRSKWSQIEYKLNRLFTAEESLNWTSCMVAGFHTPFHEDSFRMAAFAVADQLGL